jgi:uncharacterized membrane-anchored protein YitT (DUF2179 family)
VLHCCVQSVYRYKTVYIFLSIVPVCVCTLNYPVNNNHATCYIAVYGLSIGTKLYTFPYHLYQFHKTLLNINLCFEFLYKFGKKLFILKIIQTDIIVHVQYTVPYVKCRLFLLDFNNCWIFSAYLSEKITFMNLCGKICYNQTQNTW